MVLFIGDLHDGAQDVDEPRGGVWVFERVLRYRLDLEANLPLDRGEDELVLVRKVPEEGGRTHAGAVGDRLEGDIRAVLAEALQGSRDDLLDVPSRVRAHGLPP